MKTIFLSLWTAIGLLGAGTAAASLVGDTIDCEIVPGSLWACSPTSAVVGVGPEFELLLSGDPFFAVDVGAESVRLDFVSAISLSAGAEELLTLSDLDWVGMPLGEIIGISNFATTATSGVEASDITFDAHAVFIDLNDTEWSTGQYLSFDLVTNEVIVPLPASLPLLVAGVAGLGLLGRRRRAA